LTGLPFLRKVGGNSFFGYVEEMLVFWKLKADELSVLNNFFIIIFLH
jgi:hypothetical protein